VETSRLDAELLLCAVTGLERAQLYAYDDRVLNGAERESFNTMLDRRLTREPMAYILGRAHFRNLELHVDGRVLIPRPETELLVEWVLEHLGELHAANPERMLDVVDVGTGSGAIAIAVAVEAAMPLRVVATDLSLAALDVARANAERCGADVEFIQGGLLEPLADRRFDVVVSNPPYVAQSEAPSIMPDVIDHEPHLALFVPGDDPNELTAQLIEQAKELIRPHGLIALEVGHTGAPGAGRLLEEAGFQNVVSRIDLQGIERAVGGRVG
jgi:release factor glutamine methyltransferase